MNLLGSHVFIIEDNIQNRIVFQSCLIAHGAKVSFELWGYDTISVMRTVSPINLIILDLNLSNGISGFNIFDQIRSFPEFDAVKIVAVSAIDPSVGIPKTQEQGFSGFIGKPIDTRQFPAQLGKILAGKSLWIAG